jgi:hypothetical protein
MLKVSSSTLIVASLVALMSACSSGGGGSAGPAVNSQGTGSSSSSSSSTNNGTATDVLTYHNDTMRTGQNLTETVLTPSNVNSSAFGLLHQLAADGVVDATPLVVSNLSINGSMHDVVYVASENDTVYAYDLNSYALLAQVSLLQQGESAAAPTGGCTQVIPQIGVTSTPVIDRSAGPNGTLFVVAMSEDSAGNTTHRLHALDLTTLADRMPPVAIAATFPGGGGTLTFVPRQYKERGALLLTGGQIYTGWASNCDITPYNSWIMSYSEASLAQTQVINLTPNGGQGAIWSAGGILADSNGSLYALLGNGSFDSNQDYGNAAVRLTTNGSALTVADYFTPTNTVSESAQDLDFGSGSPVILPDQIDSAGTAHQLMFAAGKDSNGFLLDRTNFGKFSASVNQVFQEVTGMLPNGNFSAPSYYNGTLYIAPIGQPLFAFTINQATLPSSPSSRSSAVFNRPGASPAVSANGTTNGIVWAVESSTTAAAVLHAYNAANLSVEYYNSTQAPSGRDSFGGGNKFVTPVIADGKVFVGTPNGVAVFGLL